MGTSRAQRAATAARRERAIALRLAGVEWAVIADRLGYAGKGAAQKDVTRAMEKSVAAARESADVLRRIELERLDRISVGLWKPGTSGDTKAAETLLKISDRRMKWSGVDFDPDVEQRIRDEVTLSVATQMATVWGRALAAIGLTDEQAIRVQPALDEAVAWFIGGARRRHAIEGSVVDEELEEAS